MKILLVHNNYGKYSGEEAVVDKMAAMLQSHNHTVCFYRLTTEGARDKISDKSYVASQLFGTVMIVIASTILLGYVLAQIISLTSSPPLKIISPEPDLLTKKQSVSIKGRTNENVEVSINGVSVLTETDGSFELDVPLNSGINQFDILATNRLKKSSEVKLNVIADYQIDTSVDK